MSVRILHGDCRDVLKTLPDESVHCVVTSPPYWGLRDYNTVGQLGLEPTVGEYIEKMVEVFSEVRRVLRSDGTLWMNMGDCYSGSGRGGNPTEASSTLQGGQKSQQASMVKRAHAGKHESQIAAGARGMFWMPPRDGLKNKDLVGQPWRMAFAMQADGWYLRQDIIWSKPNPMPESVTDRCTKAHEYVFLFSRSERYFFDQEAILEPVSENTHARLAQDVQAQIGSTRAHGGGMTNRNMKAVGRRPKAWDEDLGSNRTLVAGHPRKASSYRPSGWAPSDDGSKRGNYPRVKDNTSFNEAMAIMPTKRNKRSVWTVNTQPFKEAHFATFPPALIEPCILAGCPPGGVVLDPFGGAGTTGLVADRHGRDAILIELNPEYAAMAERRITGESPLFAEVTA